MKVTQLLGSLAALLLCLACGDNRIEKGPIKRSGQADVVSLDDDWRFIRYGLQADGTRVEEPAGMFEPATDDSDWETLDVPHDFCRLIFPTDIAFNDKVRSSKRRTRLPRQSNESNS